MEVMRMYRGVAILLTGALLVVGCGDDAGTDADDADRARTGAASFELPQGDEPWDVDPASFTADVDNPFFPLEPGTRWTYRELEDGEELEVVVTVSSETREIANGVTARVVRDTVSRDGELVEDTLDWYAQDEDGNVWYMGEDTAEFDDGELSSREGAWEAGVDGALPGIVMPADPTDGMAYRQEYLEGEAEDNGEVIATGEQAEVPAGHYDDVVITKDWITIEPDVLELKFYARGVGTVLALGISGGSGREELVSMERVDEDVARAAGTSALGEPYD